MVVDSPAVQLTVVNGKSSTLKPDALPHLLWVKLRSITIPSVSFIMYRRWELGDPDLPREQNHARATAGAAVTVVVIHKSSGRDIQWLMLIHCYEHELTSFLSQTLQFAESVDARNEPDHPEDFTTSTERRCLPHEIKPLPEADGAERIEHPR